MVTVLNYLSTILNDLSDFIFFDLWLRSFLRYSNIIAANPFCVCVCVSLSDFLCFCLCVFEDEVGGGGWVMKTELNTKIQIDYTSPVQP